MRLNLLVLFCGVALAQAADPGYEWLERAYAALRVGDYDTAVEGFSKAIEADPRRTGIRKDLAYTYLKIGENEAARDQFGAAMESDPGDIQAALEYAYLCNETNRRALARRIFDRLRKLGDATAEQAFRNIDGPLAEGIARWKEAIGRGGGDFSAHLELARLAEDRDDPTLAAEHYEQAWRLRPERHAVLVDLGRMWIDAGLGENGRAALLAASRGPEPRSAEAARELLPKRYPYVSEFLRALELDPANAGLRRELGYLLLVMGRQPEAEAEFRILTEKHPDDLLAATQLAFLYYGRGDEGAAKPLFERVLAGKDEELANRVRAVLHLPQQEARRPAETAANDAKLMAERSIKAGYLTDAAKYLLTAHQTDPGDAGVMLKLGWTYNLLHQDHEAFRWFGRARAGRDPEVAAEAAEAWRNLRPANERLRTTAWAFPLYSSRWKDLFGYGQVKTEVRTGLPVRPYASVRFIGDTAGTGGAVTPVYRSESAVIVAVGASTAPWHGITLWAEAGSAMGYLTRHVLPDYRGGISVARGVGAPLRGEAPGWFADAGVDGVFVSRFGNDFLIYNQGRAGYTAGPAALRAQLYWNAELTFDTRREDWANVGETGPGFRFAPGWLPRSCFFTVDFLWGTYMADFRRGFRDFRAGFWYAVTR